MELIQYIFLIIAGFLLGVPLGLAQEIPLIQKIFFVSLVVFSLVVLVAGVFKRKTNFGKFLLLFGLLVWGVVGFWGLGIGA